MNINENENKIIRKPSKSKVTEEENYKRYIIPYNDSFEYVYISDILRNINSSVSKTSMVKPVRTIRKLATIKKRSIPMNMSISKTTLSDEYEYAIYFVCSQKIKDIIENRIKSHLFHVLEYTQKLEEMTCDNDYFESFFN